jgi:hypothetical protein
MGWRHTGTAKVVIDFMFGFSASGWMNSKIVRFAKFHEIRTTFRYHRKENLGTFLFDDINRTFQ